MNKQIVISALLGAVLLLAPRTSQARWMNPNTGRFMTLDDFEGNQEDPQSLHKYLYAHVDPANRSDPTGHLDEGALMPDFDLNFRWSVETVKGLVVVTVPRVNAYDPTGVRQGAVEYAARMHYTVISVRDVADANQKLRALPKPIRTLHIEGHGAGTGQWVGPVGPLGNAFYARGGLHGVEFFNVEEMFKAVRFTQPADIWLRGCRVAGDPSLWRQLKQKIASVTHLDTSNVHAFRSDTRVGDYGLEQPLEGLPQ